MSEEAKAIARRWFEEVWNKDRQTATAAIDAMFHPDGRAGGFPEPESTLSSAAEFKTIHKQFRDAFSDSHVDIEELVSEGDRVAIRWTANLKHTGDGLGIAPTNRKVRVPGSSFFLCKHGQIIEGWNHMDFTRILNQLSST